MENTNISYGTAIALANILGKCTIKSLGSDLFFPVIKLKANLTGAVKRYQELQQEITKECGVEVNSDGSFKFLDDTVTTKPVEVMNRLDKASRDLREDRTDVPLISLFSEKQLEDLFQENPTLTTNELEVLITLVA